MRYKIWQGILYDGICNHIHPDIHKEKRTPPITVWSSSHSPAGSPKRSAIPMIRPFTIFCKLNQISFSDRQWLAQETESLKHTDGICPVCHAKTCLSPFASYTRYLVEWVGGTPATHEITVQRYQCSSCGGTHALLSSALVPYSSYSLRFILLVLRDYFLHRGSVQTVCEHAGISVSTLYRWKSLFLVHKALWLGVLENLKLSAGTFLDGMDGAFLQGFCRKFSFSFLERLRGVSQNPPSGTPGQASGIT